MKVYRVTMVNNCEAGSENTGYCYFTNKAEAKKFANEFEKEAYDANGCSQPITEFDVELTKAGIISALNEFGSHPDNG